MARLLKFHWPFLAALAVATPLPQGCASAEARPGPVATRQSRHQSDEPDKPVESDVAAVRERLLALHNEARAGEKLRSLAVNPKLQEAAQKHAEEMAERAKMTHEGKNGSTPAERIKAEGYRYRRCGENIAFGRYSLDGLMDGWLNSPPHKKNILGAFTQIGIGCAKAKNGASYWCVNFGFPAPAR